MGRQIFILCGFCVAGFSLIIIFAGKSARKILQEHPWQNPPKFHLGGRFGYFVFFCSGEGRQSPRHQEGGEGGFGFLLKIPGGGGSRRRRGAGSRGLAGVCGEFLGGG